MGSFFGLSNSNVMVEFRIIGVEFDPEFITQKLLISPSEYWLKGEKIKNRDILRQYSCWTLKTDYEESLDINIQLEKIIGKLVSKQCDLLELKKICNISYKIEIVINIENNEKPAIYLKSDTIEFAHLIGAEFDFDLYIYS